MPDVIKNLAQLMKNKKEAGDNFVLMLGAGASLSSGVKATNTIMEEILNSYGQGLGTGSTADKFDSLWRQSNEKERRLFLTPYLNRSPSKGYEFLAEIIKLGFLDRIVTFNFDRLLESALEQNSFKDYRVIIRGETDTKAFSKLADAREPRVKIIKLHGSLVSADYFLFSKEEMLNYPPEIETLVRKITGNDLIICGYAFEDVCVIRAFSDSSEDGSLYFVNPAGAADKIKGFLIVRRSQGRVISGDIAKFDTFFETLHKELVSAGRVAQLNEDRKNPFKFLDCYREADKDWFLGREDVSQDLIQKIQSNKVQAAHLFGPAGVGKTSFILAGLAARLDPERYKCIYLRCKPEIEDQLRRELETCFALSLRQEDDWSSVLAKMKERTSKCVVIFFDQFEKAVRRSNRDKTSKDELLSLMATLIKHADDHLKPVFISLEDPENTKLIFDLLRDVDLKSINQETQRIDPLGKQSLCSIVGQLASRAGAKLDPRTIERLCDAYEARLLSLTHVQTICYYHVNGFDQNWEDYEHLPNPGLSAALASVTEDPSLMDLIAGLPSEERALIRSVLKIVCDPNASMKSIVEFIKNRFSDLKSREEFPDSVPFLSAVRP